MKTSRHRITNLKTLVEKTLPDDANLFGYDGISRLLILTSLNESYDLLACLEEYNDKFETIVLKRKISDLTTGISNLLKEGSSANTIEHTFNDFLNNISSTTLKLIA
jgi:hypothetical protein